MDEIIPSEVKLMWSQNPVHFDDGNPYHLYAINDSEETISIKGNTIKNYEISVTEYGMNAIDMSMNEEGSSSWAEMTKKAAYQIPNRPKKGIAITLGNEVLSCPSVMTEITGGQTQIKSEGNYKNGLKTGTWKYWSRDEQSIEICDYKKGIEVEVSNPD